MGLIFKVLACTDFLELLLSATLVCVCELVCASVCVCVGVIIIAGHRLISEQNLRWPIIPENIQPSSRSENSLN